MTTVTPRRPQGGGVAPIAATPAGIARRSGTGAHDRLTQRLGTGTGSCIRARPLPGPTTSRSPPHSGCSPVAAPAPSIAPAGPRCAGPDPKDLLGQTRLLLDRPPLHRHRLPTVPAGMTETPSTYAHPPPSASTRHLARADHSALARPAHPHPSAGSPACSAPETIADRARARTEPIPVPLMQP